MSDDEFESRYGDLIYTDYDRQWYWSCVRGSDRLRDAELALHDRRRAGLARLAYERVMRPR